MVCMKQKIIKWVRDAEIWISLGLITAINLILHIPFVSKLGYYREAWYIIWAGRTQLSGTLINLYKVDRPIIGYIYRVLYLILGDNPLNWQLLIFVIKLGCVLGFFLLLRNLFPKSRIFTTLAAILFSIYPGFLQFPNAVVFIN